MTGLAGRLAYPGGCVSVLPHSRIPRMFLSGVSVRERWRRSAAYPAYRLGARLYRVAVRLRAALGLAHRWNGNSQARELLDFAASCIPHVTGTVVLLGTAGPSQKLVIQLWDGCRVAGYVKLAENDRAKRLLANEERMLRALPPGRGPSLLAHGPLLGGYALVLAPVPGRPVSIGLPPPDHVLAYLRTLEQDTPLAPAEHPGLDPLRHCAEVDTAPWIARLGDRAWPVVYQHGDFAPWNLLREKSGTVTAIDWEEGRLAGFPGLDYAYYVLQVCALVRRRSPVKAYFLARQMLETLYPGGPAEAIVRLAALDAYRRAETNGHAPDEPLQRWRRAVWECST